MAKRICSIEGCDKPHHARGLCNMHRQRLASHGDPLWTRPDTSEQRFRAHVDYDGQRCELFTHNDIDRLVSA